MKMSVKTPVTWFRKSPRPHDVSKLIDSSASCFPSGLRSRLRKSVQANFCPHKLRASRVCHGS